MARNIKQMETTYTEVAFQVEEDGMVFMDTLTFPADQPMKPDAVEKHINGTFDAWKAIVTAEPVAPSKEQLAALKVRAERDKARAEATITALSAQLGGGR